MSEATNSNPTPAPSAPSATETPTNPNPTPNTESTNPTPSTPSSETPPANPAPAISQPTSEEPKGFLGGGDDPEPAPAEPADPAPVDPAPAPTEEEFEEYELVVPEGSSLTQADLDEVSNFAEQNNLTQEQAQALLDSRGNTYNAGYKAALAKYNERSANDLKELKADPFFSSTEAANESMGLINQAVQTFGDEGFKAFLKSPAGNNVHLAKFLRQLGKVISSDEIVRGQVNPPKPQEEQDSLKTMYPEFFK